MNLTRTRLRLHSLYLMGGYILSSWWLATSCPAGGWLHPVQLVVSCILSSWWLVASCPAGGWLHPVKPVVGHILSSQLVVSCILSRTYSKIVVINVFPAFAINSILCLYCLNVLLPLHLHIILHSSYI